MMKHNPQSQVELRERVIVSYGEPAHTAAARC
jgi:hypothetical protein